MSHDHSKLETGGWEALRACFDDQAPTFVGCQIPVGGDEGLPPVMARIDLPLVLEDEEQRSQNVVDAAVKQFAHTGTWPELSAWQKFFVRERLDHARVLLFALTAAHSTSGLIPFSRPFADLTPAELIEWFLIDAWVRINRLSWLEAIKARASEYQSGYEAGLDAAAQHSLPPNTQK